MTESLKKVRENTCMAGTLGRVCVRPCESNCRRANIDEAISIKSLKRFVADWEIEKNVKRDIVPKIDKSKKVAVIGAGPAGLSCAYYLAQMGYPVTVFEKLGEPGGMAAVGIPDYRLPRMVLDVEGKFVESFGVTMTVRVELGKDITLDSSRRNSMRSLSALAPIHHSRWVFRVKMRATADLSPA